MSDCITEYLDTSTRSEGVLNFSAHSSYFHLESGASFRSDASPSGAQLSAAAEYRRRRDFVEHFAWNAAFQLLT